MEETLNIKITPGEVRKSAGAAESSADQVAKLKLAVALSRVANLLPETDAATAAGEAGTAWEGDKDSWVKKVRAHATAMREDVKAIVAADDAAAVRGQGQQKMIDTSHPGEASRGAGFYASRLEGNA